MLPTDFEKLKKWREGRRRCLLAAKASGHPSPADAEKLEALLEVRRAYGASSSCTSWTA